MSLSTVQGLIRRRILVNYRVDPSVIQSLLPEPLRPKLVRGFAVAGICLIRLEQVRPKLWKWPAGLTSENAAHRIAVTGTGPSGTPEESVYILRRDSSSLLNHWAGGRIFPGEHKLSRFDVQDDAGQIDFRMTSADGGFRVALRARPATRLPSPSVFSTIAEASSFFEGGSLGYSVTRDAGRLDGVSLCVRGWRLEPLEIESLFSTYFSDASRFPEGSLALDSAFIMRDLPHEWERRPPLRLPRPAPEFASV